MIDFIKLNISYKDQKELLINSNFSWTGNHDIETGEIYEYPIFGRYHNFRIRINPNRIELKGSVHKLFNERTSGLPYNYNRFSVYDCIQELKNIIEVLDLDPEKTKIENLEFGLNLCINESVQEIINEKLITWDGRPFTKNKLYKNGSSIKSIVRSQYELKVYNKGKQESLLQEIIRIEKKVTKNIYLKRNYEIEVLTDLLEPLTYKVLGRSLIKDFEKNIIVDDKKEYLFFLFKENLTWLKLVNHDHWIKIDSRHRSKRCRDKRKLIEMIERSNRGKTRKRLINKMMKELSVILK